MYKELYHFRYNLVNFSFNTIKQIIIRNKKKHFYHHLSHNFKKLTKNKKLVCVVNGLSSKYADLNIENASFLSMNMGVFYLEDILGIKPTYWFIHNPVSLERAYKYLIKNPAAVDKLKDVKILCPSSLSLSKNCHINSKIMIWLQSILESTDFILYKENCLRIPLPEYKRLKLSEYIYSKYLRVVDTVIPENVFIPYGTRLGYDEILFTGADYLNVPHFWDENSLYTDHMNKVIDMKNLHDYDLCKKCTDYCFEISGRVPKRLKGGESLLNWYPEI